VRALAPRAIAIGRNVKRTVDITKIMINTSSMNFALWALVDFLSVFVRETVKMCNRDSED
jgi:hypothetical protein